MKDKRNSRLTISMTTGHGLSREWVLQLLNLNKVVSKNKIDQHFNAQTKSHKQATQSAANHKGGEVFKLRQYINKGLAGHQESGGRLAKERKNFFFP